MINNKNSYVLLAKLDAKPMLEPIQKLGTIIIPIAQMWKLGCN